MSSNYMALVVEEKIALQYRLQIFMSPFRHVTNFSISIHILKVIQPIWTIFGMSIICDTSFNKQPRYYT